MTDIVERARALLESVESIGGPNRTVGGDDRRNRGCKLIVNTVTLGLTTREKSGCER